MEKITYHPNGYRSVHTYEEMTPDKRPQDSLRDGTGLRFETLEHHGFDVCPEALELTDTAGRHCTYAAQDEFSDTSARPHDESMDGAKLRFETLAHGGEYPDDMPQAIRVTDPDGRSCLYRA